MSQLRPAPQPLYMMSQTLQEVQLSGHMSSKLPPLYSNTLYQKSNYPVPWLQFIKHSNKTKKIRVSAFAVPSQQYLMPALVYKQWKPYPKRAVIHLKCEDKPAFP